MHYKNFLNVILCSLLSDRLEIHFDRFSRCSPNVQQADEGTLTVVASPITLAECLVGAYRTNQPQASANFTECLTQEGADFVQISAEIGDRAARLRVKYNLKLTDEN